jgi:hypothetical protein
METTQGNSLCGYLYLKLAKNIMFLILSVLYFFLLKIRELEHKGRTSSWGGGSDGRGEVAGKVVGV